MATVRPTPKTNLACDTCRQRKSRCDGIRPTCSHCKTAGRQCTYRPTPTSLEADNAVLSRLADVEGRVKRLEHRAAHDQRADDGVALSIHNAARNGNYEPLQQSAIVKVPELHTAAAYKMLFYWPKIRLNPNVLEISAMTYLSETDESDPTLLHPITKPPPPSLMLWQVFRTFEEFYDSSINSLPACISEMFQRCPKLSGHSLFDSLGNMFRTESASISTTLVDLTALPISTLLTLSIALRSADSSRLNLSPESLMALSESSITVALQKQWILLAGSNEDRILISLLTAYCLLYYWARPFHALGLLQSIDLVMRNLSLRSPDEFIGQLFAKLHFILESDVLTEIDGIPSMSTFTILRKGNDAPSLLSSPDGSSNQTEQSFSTVSSLESHIWLRSHLNKVLHLLYGVNKAYAQPHELADLVCDLSADLRRWSQSLPLDQRFVRDATIFSMGVPSMPLRTREVALRYFSCVFLLHRPVLYFFLHKDLEYTVRPPDRRTIHSDQEPWVLESCRDCIESAALFIQFCIQGDSQSSSIVERSYRSWCDIQLLFAAHLVLLQVKSVPALFPIFRNVGDLDVLLDQVERMFELMPVKSLKVDTSLKVLRSHRKNLAAASPAYSQASG